MNKLLVITGPTATGKTKLGILLAKKLNGEILSADSRQVYKFMDIGTGKDVENLKFEIPNLKLNEKFTYGYYQDDRVRIWGLDIVEPDYPFNVADYVSYATKVIEDMCRRERLPIVVGGTGLYLRVLLAPFETIDVPRDQALRKGNYSLEELQEMLRRADGKCFEKMNESDRKNPRRLIRAIELARQANRTTGTNAQAGLNVRPEDILLIGLTAPRELLDKRIDERVEKRLKQGMEKEIKWLLARGYTREMQSMSALGYKDLSGWKEDEHKYARRQMTYLKKLFRDMGARGIMTKWYISSDGEKNGETGQRAAAAEICGIFGGG